MTYAESFPDHSARRDLPLIDESSRPTLSGPVAEATAEQRRHGELLSLLHGMHSDEVERVRRSMDGVRQGLTGVGELRAMVQTLSLRQVYAEVGSFCGALCANITTHHRLEDRIMFRDLRTADADVSPVLDRLGAEHVVIHEHLMALDEALVDLVEDTDPAAETDPAGLDAIADRVAVIAGMLRSHFGYEEEQLIGPLGRNHIII